MRLATPFAVVALSLLATAAFADAFDGFRIPDHRGHRYSATLSSRMSGGKSENPAYWTSIDAGNADLGGSASWFQDSEEHPWEVHSRSQINGTRGLYKTGGITPDGQVNRNKDLRETLEFGGSTRWYPLAAPLAVSASTGFFGSDRQTWQHDHSSITSLTPPYSRLRTAIDGRWEYDRVVSVTVGAGWGRVRDASGAHVALLLERRWLKDGLLTRPLTNEARAKLVQLFSLRQDYASVHDNPQKAFFREVEKVLREDGALSGEHLDAYATLHALDPLVRSSAYGESRSSGWFVGPMFTYRSTHVSYRTEHAETQAQSGGIPDVAFDYRYNNGFSSARDDRLFSLGAEVHHALGWRTHLDGQVVADGDLRGLRRLVLVRGTVMARHWVGERWSLAAQASEFRTIGRTWPQLQDDWTIRASGVIHYYLEDHWSLDLAANQDRTVQHYYVESRVRNYSVTLGLGWNRGALDAPGLIEPLRPLD